MVVLPFTISTTSPTNHQSPFFSNQQPAQCAQVAHCVWPHLFAKVTNHRLLAPGHPQLTTTTGNHNPLTISIILSSGLALWLVFLAGFRPSTPLLTRSTLQVQRCPHCGEACSGPLIPQISIQIQAKPFSILHCPLVLSHQTLSMKGTMEGLHQLSLSPSSEGLLYPKSTPSSAGIRRPTSTIELNRMPTSSKELNRMPISSKKINRRLHHSQSFFRTFIAQDPRIQTGSVQLQDGLTIPSQV